MKTYCPACACEAGTLSLAEAAEFLEVEILALRQFIAEGRLHPIVSGSLRVCHNSLFCQGDQL